MCLKLSLSMELQYYKVTNYVQYYNSMVYPILHSTLELQLWEPFHSQLCFDSLEIKFCVYYLVYLGIFFFRSVFGSADLILFLSNFVPKNYTYINLWNLTRHRNFRKYLTLIGYHLLTIFFVYVFERSDWSSLQGFF